MNAHAGDLTPQHIVAERLAAIHRRAARPVGAGDVARKNGAAVTRHVGHAMLDDTERRVWHLYDLSHTSQGAIASVD